MARVATTALALAGLLQSAIGSSYLRDSLNIMMQFTAIRNNTVAFGVTCDSAASPHLVIDGETVGLSTLPPGLILMDMIERTWRFEAINISTILDLEFQCKALVNAMHFESRVTRLRGSVPELGADTSLNGSSVVCRANLTHSDNLAAFNRSAIQFVLEKNGEPLEEASVGQCGESCREAQWRVQLNHTATHHCTATYHSGNVWLQDESSITLNITEITHPPEPTESPTPSSAASFTIQDMSIIMTICSYYVIVHCS